MRTILETIKTKSPELYENLKEVSNHLSKNFPAHKVATFIGFVFLLSQQSISLVPTSDVDLILHDYLELASDTQSNAPLFDGVTIVHTPSSAPLEDKFNLTRSLFEKEFSVAYGDTPAACEVFIQSA